MIKFDNIYIELYAFVLALAVLFWVFSKIKTNHLISIIIVILLSIGIYLYLNTLSVTKDLNVQQNKDILDVDIKERKETNENIFYIDKFPKKVKYLKESPELVDIITNLRFTTKFNKTRYSDIILNMNKLMKIYIYILSDRYDAITYIPMFNDVRENIIEIMYSFFMIIPNRLKHTYGINPHDQIYRSIYNFMTHSRQMLHIIEKYATIHNEEVYIPDSKYKPHNSIRSFFP